MIYTLTLKCADDSETSMSLSDQSPGPQTAGGQRMTGAAIKAVVEAGGEVWVKMFDNDVGLLVTSVVES